MRLFGLETEYGLFVEGKEVTDLVQEAMQVVRAYPGKWCGGWDYRLEDPRRDARGFRVSHLATNPEDDRIEAGSPRMTSDIEVRSDRVLVNGARFYNDHGHPEYATPECSNLYDLIAHDKAGERIVFECARARARALNADPRTIRVYKNNTDFHGMSYGCHEDYLVRREVPFDSLVAAMTPFLVTRQIFAGAGKVGGETSAGKGAIFQLSQRAEFFSCEVSVDTLDRRPIVNSREEPHADPERYRRFHVILGDANMSEYAAALKVGTTCAVLSLVESGWSPLVALKRPVASLHHISRDPSRKWEVEVVETRGGREAGMMTAVDLQRIYLREARACLEGTDEAMLWVLDAWQSVLDGLESDPWSLGDRIDWVAKEKMLQEYIDSEGIRWDDPILQGLDLEYHNLDPDDGLYHALEQSGAMRRVVTDDDIVAAQTAPPSDTRAFLRGLCVEKFHDTIQRVSWGKMVVRTGDTQQTVDMSRLVDGNVAPINEKARRSETIEEFLRVVRT